MDLATYLDRITYHGPLDLTAATLRALHVAHLQHMPFEKLDIHQRRPFGLEPIDLYDKIVIRRRGGFCYELNGLFALLLEQLGFTVTRLMAQVLNDGVLGPEFDHLTLRVPCPAEPHTWLADVGFGDSFLEPLRFDEQAAANDGTTGYRLENDGNYYWVAEENSGGTWTRQYRFDLQRRQLSDFAAMCMWQQTSPESSLMGKRLCTRATPDGRLTLSELRLITTANGQRSERQLDSEAAWLAALREYFDIVLDPDNRGRDQ
jgi:N-hydroxyarylamine O-acetyltransferase